MEKQGMGRRKRFFLIGLLIFFVLPMPIRADEGGGPEVRLETFPSSPTINNPWSVYILVKHPTPLEVDVMPPHFPPVLVLERVRADTRYIDGDERWTRVEFRFAALRAEAISLGPFEVRTPIGQAFTEEFSVNFGEETVLRRFDPIFRWVTPVTAVAPGETAALFLELVNWNPNRRIPEGFFWGKAPLNAIIAEGIPLLVREGVYRYPISVIPLDENSVILEDFSFTHSNYFLDIPQIVLPVLPVRIIAAEDTALYEDIIPEDTVVDENPGREILFPQSREKVLFLLQNEYDRIIARSRALWNDNRRAEALAELRRNERDSFCGPFLVPLRWEIEQELALGFTVDERWRPIKIPLVLFSIFIIAIAAVIIFMFVSRPNWIIRGKKVFLLRNSFIGVIIFILVIGLVAVFLEGGLGDFPADRSPGNTAVLRSTFSYRIPDFRGAVNDWFNDGQPVIVGDYNGDWRLAETPDGRSGWVPREVVVTY